MQDLPACQSSMPCGSYTASRLCSVPNLNLTSDTGLTRAQDPLLVASTSFSSPGILIETTGKDGAVYFSGEAPVSRAIVQ